MPTKREKHEDYNPSSDLDIASSRHEKFESVTTDSGFISGGNLTLTEEINPGVSSESKKVQNSSVYADSGVDLSERFFSLNIRSVDEKDVEQRPKLEPHVDDELQERGDLWKEYFQQDEDGDTLLHLAIIQGFVEVVLALIRMAPHPWLLDISNDDAQTPIHLAASIGQWRIVRWLIAAGAKPSPRNIRGDSPLHLAARNADIMCCKAIIDPVLEHEREALELCDRQHPCHRIDLDQWNYEGQTCVHIAAVEGHVDVLRYLVYHGADINAREGRQGYTALHYAVARGDERLARFLLFECEKVDAEAITYGGSSALQLGYSMPSTIADELKLRGVPEVTNTCF